MHMNESEELRWSLLNKISSTIFERERPLHDFTSKRSLKAFQIKIKVFNLKYRKYLEVKTSIMEKKPPQCLGSEAPQRPQG